MAELFDVSAPLFGAYCFTSYITVLLANDFCCVSFSSVTEGMRKYSFLSVYHRRREVCLLASVALAEVGGRVSHKDVF